MLWLALTRPISASITPPNMMLSGFAFDVNFLYIPIYPESSTIQIYIHPYPAQGFNVYLQTWIIIYSMQSYFGRCKITIIYIDGDTFVSIFIYMTIKSLVSNTVKQSSRNWGITLLDSMLNWKLCKSKKKVIVGGWMAEGWTISPNTIGKTVIYIYQNINASGKLYIFN